MKRNFDWEHRHFACIPSTQTFARHHLRCLRPGYDTHTGFVFTADAQTAAYGTHRRPWHAPPKVNLYITIAFFLPKRKKGLLPLFAYIGMNGVYQVLEQYELSPQFKGMNDLFLNDKKVAGILCENFSSRTHPDHIFVLMGLGLNVNMSQADCQKINQPATSLALQLGQPVNRDDLLNRILNRTSEDLFWLLVEPEQMELEQKPVT